MTDSATLQGKRILVVEDAFLLALEIANGLEDMGAEVLGPTGEAEGAMTLLSVTNKLDGAVVDIDLQGEKAYPIADVLAARGVPFVFATAYELSEIDPRFAHVPHFRKPVNLPVMSRAFAR